MARAARGSKAPRRAGIESGKQGQSPEEAVPTPDAPAPKIGGTRDVVARLWGLCHVLRDDGVTYGDYVTELAFLLFLKMMSETSQERRLPAGCRWEDFKDLDGPALLDRYREVLLRLGRDGTGAVGMTERVNDFDTGGFGI